MRSGLEAAIRYAQTDACFYSANDQDTVVYFAHCISRTGSYLSREAGVAEGTAMAYLIAPPLEAVVGLDAAVKAADVSIGRFYGPPSETNFAGGLLTGSQSACQAACEAFAAAVWRHCRKPGRLLNRETAPQARRHHNYIETKNGGTKWILYRHWA